MAVNYDQDFDSLNNGALAGQDSFTGAGWTVQEAVKYYGAKAIQGSSSGNVERTFSGTNNEIHWIKFVLSSSLVTQTFPGVYIGKSLAAHASIVGMLSSYIQVYNGNGSGGGSWVSTGVLAVNNDWYMIKIVLDHDAKTWDCYVDDMVTPKLTGLGFRYNTSDSLNYLRFFQNTSAAKYIDQFRIHDYDPDIWDGTSIGFNSGEGYSVGNLLYQNEWSIGSTNWKVTDLEKYEGDQSARCNAGTAYCAIPDLQGDKRDAGDYVCEAVLRSDDVSSSLDHPQWALGYIITKFASRIAIFNNSVWAYDGSVPGYVNTGYTPIDNEWVKCKVILRYENGLSTYNIYVDDMVTPKLTDLQFETIVGNGNLYLQTIRIGVRDVTFWGYVDDLKIYKPTEGGVRLLSQGLNNNPLLSGRLS